MNRRERKQRALQHASTVLYSAIDGWDRDEERYPDAADWEGVLEEIGAIADRLKDRADNLIDGYR